ncbi:TIGR00341 family protein [Mastigocoleus testarum]|nr:TIGR00341 family protein [Mastigocoleus testarum]
MDTVIVMSKTWQLFRSFGLGAIPILKLRESLLQDAELNQNYLVLIVSSCLIATFGLLINSTAVIIGAMIIAPLMSPLRGLSFGTLEGDIRLLRSSFLSIAIGSLLAIFCSCLVGIILGLPQLGSEILARTQPTLIDLLIAIVAGGISGYSKIRPSIGDAIPGTAIAVALMPPLCVVGLLLSQGEWDSAWGAMLLYLTNLIGINLACLSVYVLGGYARSNELGRSLSWGISFILIVMLAIPLGISFWQLISQARVNESVEKILVARSLVDRQDVEVIDLDINWRTKPPIVQLNARAIEPITPKEVAMVEDLLEQELEQPFTVVFDVTPSRLVKSER